jgi:hypothetical protein
MAQLVVAEPAADARRAPVEPALVAAPDAEVADAVRRVRALLAPDITRAAGPEVDVIAPVKPVAAHEVPKSGRARLNSVPGAARVVPERHKFSDTTTNFTVARKVWSGRVELNHVLSVFSGAH